MNTISKETECFTLFAPTNDYLTADAVDSLTEVYNTQKNNRVKNNDNTVVKQVFAKPHGDV